MPRPIVTVTQSVANIVTTVNEPEQKVVLVGPKYDVRRFNAASTEDTPLSLIEEEYGPFTGDNLADINLDAVSIDWELEGLSFPVDTSIVKPEYYFKDASFAVVYKNDGICTDDIFADGDVKQLSFSDRAANWSANTMHADTPADFVAKVGDTLHVAHKIASKFVLYANESISAAEGSSLVAAGTVVTVNVESTNDIACNIIEFDQINSVLYLEGTTITTATADESCVVKFGAFSLSGTLQIPDEQSFIITAVEGNALTVSLPIRSYPLAASAKKIHYRVDREVTKQWGSDITSVKINEKDDITEADSMFSVAWADGVNTVSLVHAPDLRDTSITGIQTSLSINCVHHVLTEGELHASYRALVTNQSSTILDVTSLNVNSVTTGGGLSFPDNPLGLAATTALANTGGGTISVLPIVSDDVAGYTAALQVLNADPDVYAIVPLSTDINNVILPYLNEAVRLSGPFLGKFRIVVGASAPCPTEKYLAGSVTAAATGALSLVDAVTKKYLIFDAEAAFTANGTTVGDIVRIGDSEGSVSSVINDSQLQFVAAQDQDLAVLAFPENIDYTVTRDISTDRKTQRDILIATLGSVSSPRLLMVYPGTCTVQGFSNQPGYYLSSAVGGMLSLFEPHRPKNNIALAGIEAIETSNLGYFTEDNIDALSDAGYFVLIQDTAGSAPYCVHQVTTGYPDYNATQEFGELSVVNTFDFVSRTFKNSLKPYVGTWNVIPQALSSISTTLDSTALSLRSKRVDLIGAPLLGMTIDSLEISPTDAGTIVVTLSIRIPRVLNKITLELTSE